MEGPLGAVVKEIAGLLNKNIGRKFGKQVSLEGVLKILREPPRREFGELSVPIPRLKDITGVEFKEILESLKTDLPELRGEFISEAKVVGSYLNFYVNYTNLTKTLFAELSKKEFSYGLPEKGEGLTVVVEFVSANPIHPLHIGSGRNAALGEFVARINEAMGNRVVRRYYIDDVGLQVAYLAFGYMKLGRPKPPEGFKPDHYYGYLYAATATLIDIIKLRKEAEELKTKGDVSKYSEVQMELSSLIADLERIRKRVPELVDKLIDALRDVEDPEGEVSEVAKRYEFGDPEVVEVVREVVNYVMEGIKETLEELGVKMDYWDWESDLVRSGEVAAVIERARKTPYFTLHKDAPALDFRNLITERLLEELGIPKSLEIPPLILSRSDGTTLYTTRDIAYTLRKFWDVGADKVINVIAIEQTLPQAQLKLALYALGFEKEAKNLIHYAYEMVNLPGTSMSSRRGRYVTVDEVVELLAQEIRSLMMERGGPVSEDTIKKMARSAFKYSMLSSSPKKTITFNVSKAVNLKENSAPYLQYTYARTCGLFRKVGRDEVMWRSVSIEVNDELKKELVWFLSKFPATLRKVYEDLAPEDLASYLNKVADLFNRWYDSEPIAREPNPGVREFKLGLAYGVRVVLKRGLETLGLDSIEVI